MRKHNPTAQPAGQGAEAPTLAAQGTNGLTTQGPKQGEQGQPPTNPPTPQAGGQGASTAPLLVPTETHLQCPSGMTNSQTEQAPIQGPPNTNPPTNQQTNVATSQGVPAATQGTNPSTTNQLGQAEPAPMQPTPPTGPPTPPTGEAFNQPGAITAPSIVPPMPAAAPLTHVNIPLEVAKRLQADGRWPAIAPMRDELMALCKKAKLHKIAAQTWVYAHLDKMYPPIQPAEPNRQSVGVTDDKSSGPHSGRVQGLSSIPKSWPALPANASLQAEIGWVQSNRLAVVEERDGGAVRVRLARAHEPAPSRAALGWLETSIRSYAKYVEVVARAMGSVVDEQEHVQHERLALHEIRGLLKEMRDAVIPGE